MTATTEQLLAALEKLEGSLAEATSSYESEAAKLKAKIKVVNDHLWIVQEHSADSIVEKFVALRDGRSELKKKYDAEDRTLKDEMEKCEVWLMQAADSIGAQSIKGHAGTAFIQIKTRYNCSDWPNYWEYIKEHDRFDLLEKRPAQGALKELQEEGELPPGISTYSERTITVRRS